MTHTHFGHVTIARVQGPTGVEQFASCQRRMTPHLGPISCEVTGPIGDTQTDA